MRILFKLSNHADLAKNPQLLAYFRGPLGAHPGPMTELHFKNSAWQTNMIGTVPGAALAAKDVILIFQRVCGLAQVVTHLVEVAGPPVQNANPGNGYPNLVPVIVLKQLNHALLGPVQYNAGNDGLAAHLPIPGAVQTLVRLHHLLGLPPQTLSIQDGRFRHTYTPANVQIAQAALAQNLTAANGFV